MLAFVLRSTFKNFQDAKKIDQIMCFFFLIKGYKEIFIITRKIILFLRIQKVFLLQTVF